MSNQKIGLLGGTFDPIHFGHLNLAFELMEKRNLDQVWFIPAQVNPFKMKRPPISMDHRLAMVQLALQNIPQFHLKDLERERPPPSYTIDTLKSFIAEEAYSHSPRQFALLLGEDAIPSFYQWHLPEEIIKLVPLYIGFRSGIEQYELNLFSQTIQEAIQSGLTATRLMDISGTDIRDRLEKRLYCGHLVPGAVLDYIEENQIYRGQN